MKFTHLHALTIVTSIVLSGCAVNNAKSDVGFGMAYHAAITEGQDGTYIASVEASLLRGRTDGATGLATQDATEKCRSMGKAMQVIKNETDSHFLVNGVSRLTFKCI